MTWVKLDASYYFDPKVERVSPLAELLFVRGLCHAKAHLTDGLISRRALAGVAPEDYDADGDRIAPERLAAELVAAGLWLEERDDASRVSGWRIAAWLEHNAPADEVRAKRSSEAERLRSYRSRTRVRTEPVRAHGTESVRAPETETEAEAETHSLSHDDETSTPSRAPAELEREHRTRVDLALLLLAEHDVAAAQNVRNPRALREHALKTRRRDDLAELERLALEDPSLLPDELADAILGTDSALDARGGRHSARSGSCELCGVDWHDPGHGRAHAEALAGLDRPPLTAIAGGRA